MSKTLACALAASYCLGLQTVGAQILGAQTGAAQRMAAQTAVTRLVTIRSTVDQLDQPYALYVPRSYDPARRYPVVISLHEEDSNHVINLKRIFGIPPRYGETGLQALSTLPVLRDVDYLVACPFARGTMGYQGIAEHD